MDYTLEFRTLAAEVDWTEDARCAVPPSTMGSVEYIKDELMRSLRRRERRPAPVSPEIPNSPGGPPPNSASRAPESPSVPTPEEPMQVGGAHLSPEERNRRLRAGECVYCGRTGHSLPACPRRPKDRQARPPPSASSFNGSPFQALIDSGAEENFIDEQAAEQAGIPSEPLERPRNALAVVDGRILAQSALSPTGEAPTPHSPLIKPVDLSGVPPAYHDLQEVFNKDKALSLPPHRPYDCAIELLPDAPLPSSRLYNLTRPEQEAMEGYINDSMACWHHPPLNISSATIFTKLDLRNAYHLVRIREGDGTNGRQPSTPPWATLST
ncbi:hypothetical protein L3Q82_002431 [Scortum barcoo]|uniref:Uncharacterized protein n=1 Tax=Scortum barcoo TaxID=214431 RepID=A0ACB8VZB3_9TELE|nr:hypothetical protein L3Q82_002431 [Scortum barcoo]